MFRKGLLSTAHTSLKLAPFTTLAKSALQQQPSVKSSSIGATRSFAVFPSVMPTPTGTLSKKPQPVGTYDHLTVPIENLKGYENLCQRFSDLIDDSIAAAVISPAVSGVWLLATQQVLLESPVAAAVLITGGLFVSQRMMEMKRLKNYAQMSTIIHAKDLSTSEEDNQRISRIVAGSEPRIKLTSSGLAISGLVGDVKNPSSVVQDTHAKIREMNKVVVPESVLNPRTKHHVNHTHERWVARINYPLAILNILAIMSKDPKDRTPDDYVVLATSGASIYDYFAGDGVSEAREKFSNTLKNCQNVDQVLKVLIERDILDKGAMSFLNEWKKDQQSIGVRVSRTGLLELYKHRQFSIGGPYPRKMFPEVKQEEVEKVEVSQKTRSFRR